VSPNDGARNTALAAYQSVAAPNVNAARWGPAALALTSSATTELLPLAERRTNGTPALEPGATEPGLPPVIRPENTNEPAGTLAVVPEVADTPWPFPSAYVDSDPAAATPQYSAAVPLR